MLRLTLLTSLIASGTFFATLAYAPAIVDITSLVWSGRTGLAQEASAAPSTPDRLDCRSPFAKIAAALQNTPCP